MKKINNNLIMLPVVLLLVFGVFSVLPTQAHAQTFTVETGATFTPNARVQEVVTTNVVSNTVSDTNSTESTNNNLLAANAFFGANSIHLSLFEWALLFLLILLIVVLIRAMLYKKEKDKPLKHA